MYKYSDNTVHIFANGVTLICLVDQWSYTNVIYWRGSEEED